MLTPRTGNTAVVTYPTAIFDRNAPEPRTLYLLPREHPTPRRSGLDMQLVQRHSDARAGFHALARTAPLLLRCLAA